MSEEECLQQLEELLYLKGQACVIGHMLEARALETLGVCQLKQGQCREAADTFKGLVHAQQVRAAFLLDLRCHACTTLLHRCGCEWF